MKTSFSSRMTPVWKSTSLAPSSGENCIATPLPRHEGRRETQTKRKISAHRAEETFAASAFEAMTPAAFGRVRAARVRRGHRDAGPRESSWRVATRMDRSFAPDREKPARRTWRNSARPNSRKLPPRKMRALSRTCAPSQKPSCWPGRVRRREQAAEGGAPSSSRRRTSSSRR